MQSEQNKAIFFDRDGVINIRIVGEYVQCYDDFKFCPDFFSLFSYVKSLGYLAIIVTNQQGIGKGIMTENDLQNVHTQMQEQIMQQTG